MKTFSVFAALLSLTLSTGGEANDFNTDRRVGELPWKNLLVSEERFVTPPEPQTAEKLEEELQKCRIELDAVIPDGELEDGEEGICNLPPMAGSCQTETGNRFFYDPELSDCLPFRWGGCDRNGNNFPDKERCLLACNQEDEQLVRTKPVTPNPLDYWRRPPKTGTNTNGYPVHCRCLPDSGPCGTGVDPVLVYFFDPALRVCRPLTACPGGNDNKFSCEEDCFNECQKFVGSSKVETQELIAAGDPPTKVFTVPPRTKTKNKPSPWIFDPAENVNDNVVYVPRPSKKVGEGIKKIRPFPGSKITDNLKDGEDRKGDIVILTKPKEWKTKNEPFVEDSESDTPSMADDDEDVDDESESVSTDRRAWEYKVEPVLTNQRVEQEEEDIEEIDKLPPVVTDRPAWVYMSKPLLDRRGGPFFLNDGDVDDDDEPVGTNRQRIRPDVTDKRQRTRVLFDDGDEGVDDGSAAVNLVQRVRPVVPDKRLRTQVLVDDDDDDDEVNLIRPVATKRRANPPIQFDSDVDEDLEEVHLAQPIVTDQHEYHWSTRVQPVVTDRHNWHRKSNIYSDASGSRRARSNLRDDLSDSLSRTEGRRIRRQALEDAASIRGISESTKSNLNDIVQRSVEGTFDKGLVMSQWTSGNQRSVRSRRESGNRLNKRSRIKKSVVDMEDELARCQDKLKQIKTDVIGPYCTLPPRGSPCWHGRLRFYYHPRTQDCHLLDYGRCSADDDNFRTKKQCLDQCAPRNYKGKFVPVLPDCGKLFRGRLPHSVPDYFPYLVLNPNVPSKCRTPASTGICSGTFTLRYFYDSAVDDCRLFFYDCAGNENIFNSRENCLQHCKGYGPNGKAPTDEEDRVSI